MPGKRGPGQPRLSAEEPTASIKVVLPAAMHDKPIKVALPESVKARLPRAKRGDLSAFVVRAVEQHLKTTGLERLPTSPRGSLSRFVRRALVLLLEAESR
jgi:hypothetical protein